MTDRRTLLAMLAGAAGGGAAIALMEAFAAFGSFPLFAVPFATSIVLVMGSPEAQPAQPRALIGGHLLSTLIGLAVVKLVGPGPWASAIAVGLAVIAMQMTGVFHLPAGINPLLVVANDLSWDFFFIPVAAGAGLLTAFAWGWHNFIRGYRWPERWT